MSKPVKVRYIWNKENIDKLFDASYKYQFHHSVKRYVGWFLIVLVQFGVIAAIKKGSMALLLFATMMLVYWYYGKKYLAKRRAEKSYENSSFKNKEIEMYIDDEGFTIVSNPQETWKWDEVDEVIDLSDSIMLYKYPNFHYIPLQGFASLEEKSRFKSLAKAQGKLR